MASKTMGAAIAVVAALLLVSVASAQYGNPSEDPQTTNYTLMSQGVSGLPDVARCIGPNRCYQRLLFCSHECHSRSQAKKGEKCCFIDCGSRCETTCKHRKPNCYGFGSMCYDPRLVGGDGSMFYFHGEKDQDFCLVSDRSLHINGHMIGLRPEGRTRDYTWVQSLGLLFGSHKFSVGAKKVSQWDENEDQLIFSFDGVPFAIAEESGNKWTSEDSQIKVERTYQKNVVEVTIDGMLSMLVEVVPITAQDDKAHNYQLPRDDVFAHLDLQFKFYNLSATVNGVLGQTYQPGYVSPAKVGVKMPVLGGEDRFLATGLLNADCKASQFLPEPVDAEEIVQVLSPFRTDCSSKDAGTGIVCRR